MPYNELDQNSDKIRQPRNMTIELMDHQKTIIHAMQELETKGYINVDDESDIGLDYKFKINTNVGILCDRVGAGKSLMVIGFLNENRTFAKKNCIWESSRYLTIEVIKHNDVNTNLVIVPHSLIHQWISFFEHAPTIKMKRYYSAQDVRDLDTIDKIKQYDVILISDTKAKHFFDDLPTYKWGRIFVDEADTIRIPRKLELMTKFLWLVTATPKGLNYNKRNLIKPLFKNMEPWVFKYLLVKNKPEYIEQSIILPPPTRYVIRCLTPWGIQIVKGIIPNSVLAMINAGNTEEAIKSLACKVDSKMNIVQAVTFKLNKDMVTKLEELDKEEEIVSEMIKPSVEKLDYIGKLKKSINRLKVRITSITEKINKSDEECCPICMDEMEKPTLLNCCQNMFCFDCITICMNTKNTCPLCRQTIDKQAMHVIDSKLKKRMENLMNKLDMTLEIIKAKKNGKFLLFASYDHTFNTIATELRKHGISYKVLNGRAMEIQKSIDSFENGDTQVLLLNTKYFGAGMNLQMASDVIIYHRFTKEMEEQAIGRAQRFGRKTKLNVFFLVHENELQSFDNNTVMEDGEYSEWLENPDLNMTEINYESIKKSIDTENNTVNKLAEMDKETIELDDKGIDDLLDSLDFADKKALQKVFGDEESESSSEYDMVDFKDPTKLYTDFTGELDIY